MLVRIAASICFAALFSGTTSWSQPLELRATESAPCISLTFDPSTNVAELIEKTTGECANGRLSALTALDTMNDELGVSIRISNQDPSSLFDFGQRRTIRKGLHGYRVYTETDHKKFRFRLKSAQAALIARAFREGDLFHVAVSFGRSRWVGASFNSSNTTEDVSSPSITSLETASQNQTCDWSDGRTASVCTDSELCRIATRGTPARWASSGRGGVFASAARRRGLTCGVVEQGTATPTNVSHSEVCSRNNLQLCDADQLCRRAAYGSPKRWFTSGTAVSFSNEAKRRGLTCGVGEQAASTTTVSSSSSDQCSLNNVHACSSEQLCDRGTYGTPIRWYERANLSGFSNEAKRRGLTCGVAVQTTPDTQCSPTNPVACTTEELCSRATVGTPKVWLIAGHGARYTNEAKRRGLTCGTSNTQRSSPVSSNTPRSTTPDISNSPSDCTAAGRGFGLTESAFWHRTASAACKREYFERACRGYGFVSGTPEMAQCVVNEINNSRARSDQKHREIDQIFRDSQRTSPSYRCRDLGFGRIRCDPY